MELQHEFDRAWRLTTLDVEEAEFGRSDRRRARDSSRDSDDDDTTDTDFSEGEFEATLPAHEMPILRYLIKHFLLTLPIIRDTVAVTSAGDGERPDSAYFASGDDADGMMPIYWSAGVLPILRSLHQRDLSQPVDMGRRGFGSIVGGLYGMKALERFVAGGLKLSTGSAKYENQEDRRRSLMNPLRDIQLPTEPLSREASMRKDYHYPQRSKNNRDSRDSRDEPQTGRRNRFSVAGIFGKRSTTGQIGTIGEEEDDDQEASSRKVKDASKDKSRISMPVSEKAEVGVMSPAAEVLDLDKDIPEDVPEESAAKEIKEEEAEKVEKAEEAQAAVAEKEGEEPATSLPATAADPDTSASGGLSSWLPAIFGTGAAAKASDSKDNVSTPEVNGDTPEKSAGARPSDHVPGAFGTAPTSEASNSVNPSPQTATSPFENQSLFTAEDGGDSTDDDPFARPTVLVHADSDETGTTMTPRGAREPDLNAAGYDVPEPQHAPPHKSSEAVVSNSASVADDVGSQPQTPDTPAAMYRQRLQESEKETAEEKRKALASSASPSKLSKQDNRVSSPTGKRKFHLSIPGRKPRSSSLAPTSSGSASPAPSSPGATSGKKKGFFAAMAVPSSIAARSEASMAPRSMDLSVPLVEKYGHSWPWGAPVPFWKGTPVHKVAWGGFEVDVVGLRKTFTGHVSLFPFERS